MEQSFNEVKPVFKTSLEKQLKNIEIQIERQKKLHEEAEKQQKISEENKEKEGDKPDEAPEVPALPAQDPKDVVDSDKIKAITSMVDEFNNIVAKNFSVYAHYDDFSFANSRSAD